MTSLSLIPNPAEPLLVVVTILGGFSPTGVETHFNEVLRQASQRGQQTQLFTPYTGEKWERAVFRVLKNRPSELARVLYRYGQGWLLKQQLRRLRRKHPSRRVTLYAQCVMSARAAVAVSADLPTWKTLLVVHFNHSESAEVVGKRLTSPGSYWCRHLDRLEAKVLPRLDGIIFVSRYMSEILNLRLRDLTYVRQEIIFNFPPRPVGEPTREIVGDLITIGTLEPRKNQGYLLRIMAEAKKKGFCFSLTLVGDGPDRAKFEQLALELGIQDQVRFEGLKLNAAELIPHYRCLAHVSLLENCPIVIIEALSYGKPVFAAPVGGIPELFRDGVEGRFCDLSDPVQAADRLIDLLSNPQSYARCAAAARIRYDTVFAPLPERWVALLGRLGREPNALEIY